MSPRRFQVRKTTQEKIPVKTIEEEFSAVEEYGLPVNVLDNLSGRNHTLNGAVLIGLDGLVIEVQARAMDVFRQVLIGVVL